MRACVHLCGVVWMRERTCTITLTLTAHKRWMMHHPCGYAPTCYHDTCLRWDARAGGLGGHRPRKDQRHTVSAPTSQGPKQPCRQGGSSVGEPNPHVWIDRHPAQRVHEAVSGHRRAGSPKLRCMRCVGGGGACIAKQSHSSSSRCGCDTAP